MPTFLDYKLPRTPEGCRDDAEFQQLLLIYEALFHIKDEVENIDNFAGGNATTLDGLDSTEFARKAIDETITGTWTFDTPVTAQQFIETSDRRLKKNIKPLGKVMQFIRSLVGVRYKRKDTGVEEIGFIAQDVQKLFPELVSQQGKYLGINYSRLVAVLVEGLKEQDKRISILEDKIAAMKRNL